MIFTPSAGPLGAHPAPYITKCVARVATLAVGDVVVTSFLHSTPVLDPSLGYDPLYVFNCVAPADGNLTNNNGYIGVVTDLNGTSGAAGSIVTVQFGGIVTAKVTPSTTLVPGTILTPSDAGATFVDGGGATAATVGGAVLMQDTTGTSTILARVFVPLQYWFRIATP